jgi:hypothetical protein
MFLTLLTLIAIFLIDSTLGKTFNSQHNNKDVFRNNSRGKQRVKEMLRNNHANFWTISLKTETNKDFVPNNGPNITTSSFLQLPNDSPAKQHPVPHDGPAHFKQLSVPMTITSTGLQTDNDCHSILNDVTERSIWHQAFDHTLSRCPIMNVSNKTLVPALNALLTSSYSHPAGGMTAHIDATPTSLLLLHIKVVLVNMATIHDPSLLLPLC